MRQILSILLGICVATSVSFAAHAQQYPTKPVTIVVPTGPGGSYDLVARRLEKALAKNLGQSRAHARGVKKSPKPLTYAR